MRFGATILVIKELTIKPLNDLCKVKLEQAGPFSAGGKATAECGILVELPDILTYFGFWSFAFENSFMNKEALTELLEYWKTKIGRKVYWTALSERGNILETTTMVGDVEVTEQFAYIKMTSLIAESDPEDTARSVHTDGDGAFGMEQ